MDTLDDDATNSFICSRLYDDRMMTMMMTTMTTMMMVMTDDDDGHRPERALGREASRVSFLS
jgi:hypothetical protein